MQEFRVGIFERIQIIRSRLEQADSAPYQGDHKKGMNKLPAYAGSASHYTL